MELPKMKSMRSVLSFLVGAGIASCLHLCGVMSRFRTRRTERTACAAEPRAEAAQLTAA
jgi:hypothetical protein